MRALETAHAVAGLKKISKRFKNKIVILNLSGRGDKDVNVASGALGINNE